MSLKAFLCGQHCFFLLKKKIPVKPQKTRKSLFIIHTFFGEHSPSLSHSNTPFPDLVFNDRRRLYLPPWIVYCLSRRCHSSPHGTSTPALGPSVMRRTPLSRFEGGEKNKVFSRCAWKRGRLVVVACVVVWSAIELDKLRRWADYLSVGLAHVGQRSNSLKQVESI